MHIPTHQIHNVLNAYARRLKAIHEAGDGPAGKSTDNRIDSRPADVDRQWIMDKISADMIRRIIRSGPRTQPDPSNAEPGTLSQAPIIQNHEMEEIHYHVLMPDGTKIPKTIQLQDPDFLIRQIEETARNGRK